MSSCLRDMSKSPRPVKVERAGGSTPSSWRPRGQHPSCDRPLSWPRRWTSCSSFYVASRPARPVSRVASGPDARCLIISIADGSSYPELPSRTSGSGFHFGQRRPSSDLSLKRNLGLLLARSHGGARSSTWSRHHARQNRQLGRTRRTSWRPIRSPHGGAAGSPDNSVVCHARRRRRLTRTCSLLGDMLGVRCNSLRFRCFGHLQRRLVLLC